MAEGSLALLGLTFQYVGVVVSTLEVVIGHAAGSPWEMAVTRVLSQLLMRSLSFMRPFLPFFHRELTDMTGNASSIGL